VQKQLVPLSSRLPHTKLGPAQPTTVLYCIGSRSKGPTRTSWPRRLDARPFGRTAPIGPGSLHCLAVVAATYYLYKPAAAKSAGYVCVVPGGRGSETVLFAWRESLWPNGMMCVQCFGQACGGQMARWVACAVAWRWSWLSQDACAYLPPMSRAGS
jgi:hypothetical protein